MRLDEFERAKLDLAPNVEEIRVLEEGEHITPDHTPLEAAEIAYKAALKHINNGNANYAEPILKAAVALLNNDGPAKPEEEFKFRHLLGIVQCHVGNKEWINTLVNTGVRSEDPEIWFNIGVGLTANGDKQTAIWAYDQALKRAPNHIPSVVNRAIALGETLQMEKAIAAYREAIKLSPNDPSLKWNLAHALIQTGQWTEGWELFWHRWEVFPHFRKAREKLLAARPEWLGENLAGKTLLTHCEQGFGDKIQFARYFPLLHKLGAKVLFQCPPELWALFQGIEDVELVPIESEPAHDYHVSLMDLPLRFGTTPETIPPPVVFNKSYSKQLGFPVHFKIGINWSGSVVHRQDYIRSCPLKYFEPLVDQTNKLFALTTDYRLKKWPQKKEPVDLQADVNFKVVDLAAQLDSFDHTAAVINSLDVVVTVDSAVAHLAGSMGKPTFLLLPWLPDFRWLLETDKTNWYPSVKIFRQSKLGDWESVLKIVAEEINKIKEK
jgi:hypothetical protein